jgi:hypothetical protein
LRSFIIIASSACRFCRRPEPVPTGSAALAVAVSGTTNGAAMTTVQHLELQVAGDQAALLRIAGACHQRGNRIAALNDERLPGGGHVVPDVEAANREIRRPGLWRANLIRVLDVQHEDDQPVLPVPR